MRAFHADWAYAVIATNLASGAWGLVMWRRRHTPPRTFWWALGAAWTTILVQGVTGLVLFRRYRPPFKHTFYGFLFVIVVLLVLPLRTETERSRLLVFAGATLFIGIVAVRAKFSL